MKVPFYGLKLPNSDQIILSEVESRHCIKVLRYKVGDEVQVLDGRGNLYSCSISSEKLQQCTLDINATDFKDRDDCGVLKIELRGDKIVTKAGLRAYEKTGFKGITKIHDNLIRVLTMEMLIAVPTKGAYK